MSAETSSKKLFEQHKDGAILGQFINHEDGEPAKAIEGPSNPDEIVALIDPENENAIFEVFDELDKIIADEEAELVASDPDENVPEQDRVVGDTGMTLAELEALKIATEEKAANYDKNLQEESAAQFVNEAKIDKEVAAGMESKPPENPNAHFEQAENHGKTADVHNKSARTNEIHRDTMDAQAADLDKALQAAPNAPNPIEPKGPGFS